jgi:fatty acid amide hydrolase 2
VTIARTSSADLPPFFGVPCTIKELISVEGLPFTAGVPSRRHVVGTEDAPLVARMRRAGCIILGLTNVSEAGLWLETHNTLYGRTSNAYSVRHISGGSSGGEGAIIGAGGSAIGLGADVGGSIRNPCFFNGIVGHKPTGGLLPSTGHWPPAEGQRGRYCVTGPMGRTVRDLAAMMRAFSPKDDPYRDPSYPPFEPLKSAPRSEVQIHYFGDNGLARLSVEMADAIERTVSALSRRGFKTERWRPSKLSRSAEIWSAKLGETDDMTVTELLGNGEPIPMSMEWLRTSIRRSGHSFAALVMATLDRIARAAVSDRLRASLVEMAAELQAEIESKLGATGVLVCPPYPRAAPLHLRPMLSPFAFSYCGIFNVLEFPSTAVPVGFNREGLPLGVQVVGKRANDRLTLAVAEEIESIFGGWRPIPRPRP